VVRGRAAPIADPDDAAAAEAVAVRILAGAAHSEAGLRRRLEQRGFTRAVAAATAAAMVRRGYVDDDAFAAALAERGLRRGRGRALVAAELRARGVAERPIDDAVRGIDPDAELVAATVAAARLAASRAGRDGFDAGRVRGYVGGALQRRGFDMGTVRRALQAAGLDGTDELLP